MKKKVVSVILICILLSVLIGLVCFLFQGKKDINKSYPTDRKALAAVMVGGKWGFIDRWGNFVITPIYKEVGEFSDGVAAVKVEDKWGFINAFGEMIIEPSFDTYEEYFLSAFISSDICVALV